MKDFYQTLRKNSAAGKLGKALALCFFTLLLTACNQGSVPKGPAPADQGLSHSYVQDLLTLTLHTSKNTITVAGQLELVLEAVVPENVEVEFPAYSAGLGDFTLKDTRVHTPRLHGSGDNIRVSHRVTYILEPYLPGPYVIPIMTVKFRDKNKDTEINTITTEEIQVPVLSVLGPDAVPEIKDIKPPLSLPRNTALQLLVLAVLLLLGLAAAAGLLYWKKAGAKKSPAGVQLRAEEIALQELDQLLAEKLLARGETKLFHLRISDILRRYIENRFGLKAPERTTEEFLFEVSQAKFAAKTLLGVHKALLAAFLTQCDLVKFARHEPTMAESDKTVALCREFIEKTREKESF